MQPISIVTGASGQDGSILSEQLLERGHKVFGVFRRLSSSPNLGCAEGLDSNPNFRVVEGDITDLSFLTRLCKSTRPDYLYGLASQSHVGTSFEEPLHTAQVTGLGVLNALEAIRNSGIHTRFYNAATSELFGGVAPPDGSVSYNEASPFYPRSPYAVAKLFGYWITVNYRESYKMFAANGLAFNHEGTKRGPNFVTRKITLAVARIKAGLQDKVKLGNLDAMRDWGYAPDFTTAYQLILEAPHPDDFVIATGETHSVREFCQLAFEMAGLGDYQRYVEIDPALYRPAEVAVLKGDYSKIERVLGWRPETKFKELVGIMVESDCKKYQVEL